jgi:ankyrin repeat protein
MSGVTELLGVIRRGDTKAVEDLLAAHPDLANARDEKGNSPVLMATYAGKQDIVRLLLDRGARPNVFEACALGLDADVRQQLRDDPGAVRQWAHDGWTPLHLAAYFGHRKTAEVLLEAGADALAVSRNGEGNLASAFNGDVALVRLLLDNGADRSLRTGDGQTALEIAGTQGQHEVARLLSG